MWSLTTRLADVWFVPILFASEFPFHWLVLTKEATLAYCWKHRRRRSQRYCASQSASWPTIIGTTSAIVHSRDKCRWFSWRFEECSGFESHTGHTENHIPITEFWRSYTSQRLLTKVTKRISHCLQNYWIVLPDYFREMYMWFFYKFWKTRCWDCIEDCPPRAVLVISVCCSSGWGQQLVSDVFGQLLPKYFHTPGHHNASAFHKAMWYSELFAALDCVVSLNWCLWEHRPSTCSSSSNNLCGFWSVSSVSDSSLIPGRPRLDLTNRTGIPVHHSKEMFNVAPGEKAISIFF